MITWFPVRRQGLASTVETFCRFSIKRTSTGGRSEQPPAFLNHIQYIQHFCALICWAKPEELSTGSLIFCVRMCVCLIGLSHRGRQCRFNSKPAPWGEEESVCEERSGACYHRYGTPLSSMQPSREALLIMQIRHRLLAAQTHRQQRQHLFLSISYKHFICTGRSSSSHLSSLLLCQWALENW